ncbi:hypothetical protein Ae707Ps1_5929 [Pseudonocardia sp. Ae707_Ps1]|nr:hypothetical protein Ae707Ps1_5929 [Pseudonocardia sp. Ae707_Ps1]
MNHSISRPTIRRVLCTRGALAVTVCPLCAALVLTDGLEQHARVHAAEFDRRPAPSGRSHHDPRDDRADGDQDPIESTGAEAPPP